MTNSVVTRNSGENGEGPLVKKTICLGQEVLDLATAGARREHRSFSNYLAWLIRKDVAVAVPSPEEEKVA